MSVNNFTEKLINWYNVNKRDLPWRSSRDPYLIWVSEIILQQTQIKQGLPYYYKFISFYELCNVFFQVTIWLLYVTMTMLFATVDEILAIANLMSAIRSILL